MNGKTMTDLIENYNTQYEKKRLGMWLDLSTYCNAKCPQCHRTNADGLEKVAEDIGFIETAKDHTYADGALADYGVKGIDNERASVGLAGVIGVIGTAVVGGALFTFIARKPKKVNK